MINTCTLIPLVRFSVNSLSFRLSYIDGNMYTQIYCMDWVKNKTLYSGWKNN